MRTSFLLSTSLILLGSSGVLTLPGIASDAAYATSTATTMVTKTPEDQLADLRAQRARATARRAQLQLDSAIKVLEDQIAAGTAVSVTTPAPASSSSPSVPAGPVASPSTSPITSAPSTPVVKTPEDQLADLRAQRMHATGRRAQLQLDSAIKVLEDQIAASAVVSAAPS
ncbi:MAG: hypothetical protein C0514_06205, partial [Candidatus Puniceispirillum sp.]|nr:hypothetical protein [Candidatus Puniceispirillum sp.]